MLQIGLSPVRSVSLITAYTASCLASVWLLSLPGAAVSVPKCLWYQLEHMWVFSWKSPSASSFEAHIVVGT